MQLNLFPCECVAKLPQPTPGSSIENTSFRCFEAFRHSQAVRLVVIAEPSWVLPNSLASSLACLCAVLAQLSRDFCEWSSVARIGSHSIVLLRLRVSSLRCLMFRLPQHISRMLQMLRQSSKSVYRRLHLSICGLVLPLHVLTSPYVLTCRAA